MTKASDNAFPSILITEGTEPTAPAAGKQRLYIDSTSHVLMRTNSSGTEVAVEAAGVASTSYTPALTAASSNPTLGTGSSVSGSYFRIGKLVIGRFLITFGSSGVNAGSGIYYVSLPVANLAGQSSGRAGGTAQLRDSSGSVLALAGFSISSTDTKVSLFTTSDVTHAFPWTWAANDTIGGFFIYESS